MHSLNTKWLWVLLLCLVKICTFLGGRGVVRSECNFFTYEFPSYEELMAVSVNNGVIFAFL